MITLFGRKKLTENTIANIFVNSLVDLVDKGFEDVAELIRTDPSFVRSPQIDPNNSDPFLLILVAGNISYIPKYFNSGQDRRIIELSMEKLANMYDMEKLEFATLVKEYKTLMTRLNHPSKNTLYAMSKAVFAKYNLNEFQEEYFRDLNTPNPIFLKKMNEIMEHFIWNWEAFFDKYKVSS
ncbi:MAG: hypothetical protein EA392_03645 [Cryomorphaceae bacterium]|nr:MAG: hypothetical protein EA392_03645 [Cryomorphaceae bacterium]